MRNGRKRWRLDTPCEPDNLTGLGVYGDVSETTSYVQS